MRRMGELLKQFDGRPANASKQTDGTDSLISQKDAARAAGISERQQVTAVRVANVPDEQFETAIERPKPATVSIISNSNHLAWRVFTRQRLVDFQLGTPPPRRTNRRSPG